MYSVLDSPNSDFDDDQEYYSVFSILLMNGAPRYGRKKNNKLNDCLYDVLKLALHDKCPWKTACKLKKFLKIERNAMIGIEHLPMIEEKINHKFVVTGDHIYNSTKKCIKEIHIKL